MEGPTPVSSLLHSSTMVVAGVFVLSFFGGFFKDFKRVIAYSTSSQLALIGILFCLGHFLGSISYILTHARFKAFLFIFCGIIIHSSDLQLLGFLGSNFLFIGIFCFLVLGIIGA